MLDDALAENTASAVLDDTPSSSQAVEGNLASLSRRAPSRALLDAIVSHKPPRRDVRWHSASTYLLSQVLDTLLLVPSRAESADKRQQTLGPVMLDSTPSSRTP